MTLRIKVVADGRRRAAEERWEGQEAASEREKMSEGKKSEGRDCDCDCMGRREERGGGEGGGEIDPSLLVVVVVREHGRGAL